VLALRPPLTVAAINRDIFQNVNATHGSASGDSVLVAFAKRPRAVLRQHGVLGRIGGKELMSLLVNNGRASAARVPRQDRSRPVAPTPCHLRLFGRTAAEPGQRLCNVTLGTYNPVASTRLS